MQSLNLFSQALVLLFPFRRPLCAINRSFLHSSDNFDELLLFCIHIFVVSHFGLELLFEIALVGKEVLDS